MILRRSFWVVGSFSQLQPRHCHPSSPIYHHICRILKYGLNSFRPFFNTIHLHPIPASKLHTPGAVCEERLRFIKTAFSQKLRALSPNPPEYLSILRSSVHQPSFHHERVLGAFVVSNPKSFEPHTEAALLGKFGIPSGVGARRLSSFFDFATHWRSEDGGADGQQV
jgi:hypothetical protein